MAASLRSSRRLSTAKGSAGLATRHVSSRNTLQCNNSSDMLCYVKHVLCNMLQGWEVICPEHCKWQRRLGHQAHLLNEYPAGVTQGDMRYGVM
jgi:hypothetical protein